MAKTKAELEQELEDLKSQEVKSLNVVVSHTVKYGAYSKEALFSSVSLDNILTNKNDFRLVSIAKELMQTREMLSHYRVLLEIQEIGAKEYETLSQQSMVTLGRLASTLDAIEVNDEDEVIKFENERLLNTLHDIFENTVTEFIGFEVEED